MSVAAMPEVLALVTTYVDMITIMPISVFIGIFAVFPPLTKLFLNSKVYL